MKFMMLSTPRIFILAFVLLLGATTLLSHPPEEHRKEEKSKPSTRPARAENRKDKWNKGDKPKDWRAEIERYHGHVGPWNVVGYRIAQDALDRFDVRWGEHSMFPSRPLIAAWPMAWQ